MSGGAANSLKPPPRGTHPTKFKAVRLTGRMFMVAPPHLDWMLAKTLPDGECIAGEPASHLKKGLLSVANDETGHAAYEEGMMRRMSAA